MSFDGIYDKKKMEKENEDNLDRLRRVEEGIFGKGSVKCAEDGCERWMPASMLTGGKCEKHREKIN